MATGRPVESDVSKSLRAGKTVELFPGILGAKNWPHTSFNPNTGLIYATTNTGYSTYRFLPLAEYKPGLRYQGIENINSPITPDTIAGHLEALDPLTGQPKWRMPLKGHTISSAMLTTGGGLLFAGRPTGEFIAVDADNGNLLWSFKTGSGIHAQPITWTKNGKQYVTILSGSGGVAAARRGLPDMPLGGSVWTFALFDQ
jgi:alcohol dehydrogenase (cytochrome c)